MSPPHRENLYRAYPPFFLRRVPVPATCLRRCISRQPAAAPIRPGRHLHRNQFKPNCLTANHLRNLPLLPGGRIRLVRIVHPLQDPHHRPCLPEIPIRRRTGQNNPLSRRNLPLTGRFRKKGRRGEARPRLTGVRKKCLKERIHAGTM